MAREKLEIRGLIQDIVESCDGAAGGVVMGFDGSAVEAISGPREIDIQTIGMEFSFVLGQVRKAAELLDVGALEEVSIRSESLTFMIRVLNEEYFLGVAMRPSGNIGKAKFLMRLAAPQLLSRL